jgi:hypothetical protein
LALYVYTITTGGKEYMINLNQIFLSSDISMTINDELNKCYEQLQGIDISDMTTDQLLQYMQMLYMIQLRNDVSWIKEHTEGIANTVADKIF